MTPVVLDRPDTTLGARMGRSLPRAEQTLAGALAGVWEDLAAHRGVGCPVCGGRMAPRYGASGLEPVGGRCSDCGATLG